MKKTFFLVATAIFVLPVFAFGATTYVRTPTGSSITSPVSVSASSDDILTDFFFGDINPQTWTIAIFDEVGADDRFGSYVSSSTLSLTEVFDLPIGYQGHAEIQTNENNHDVLLLGSFTIISASSQPMFSVPTSTASALTANITTQLGDVGTLALIVIVASIPLAFYVIKKIISLVPKK